MVDVRMKFSPPLVGGRGPTGPQGASIVGGTVNAVTGHLVLTLSNGSTFDAGPVSAEKVTYTIDLTSAASASITRAGEALAQTGTNTAQVVPPDTPIIETMDGWTGMWSHTAITNLVGWDFTGFSNSGSPTVATGQADPAGGTNAIKVTDAQAGSVSGRFQAASSYSVSIWARNDVSNPPSSPGVVAASITPDTTNSETVSGTSWARYEFGGGDALALGSYVAMWPAGLTTAGVTTVAATGAAHYYWPFATASTQNHIGPTAKTTLAATGAPLVASALAALATDGTLDVELEFLPSWLKGIAGLADCYLWSANAGAHSLRYNSATTTMILKINGTDRLSADLVGAGVAGAVQGSVRGHLARVRAWWDPLRGEAGIRMSVGGATAFDQTTTTTGGILSPITSFWLGSNGASTTGVATMRHRRLITRVSAARDYVTEGIWLGDSTTASYPLLDGVAVPAYLYQDAEQAADRVRCIGVPGETITQQKARWQALSSTVRSSASWVALQPGLNDLATSATTSATIISRLQDLVTTIRADNATCKIVIGQMTPAKQRWIDIFGGGTGAAQQTKWSEINAAVNNGGGTPITGVDARVTSYVAALNDGSGNLAAAYETYANDHIHPNNVGRQIIAAAYRTALGGLGLI